MSVKAKLAGLLGPTSVRHIKRLLGRSQLDEVTLVHAVFARIGQPGMMIDVGAHHGHALLPFVKDGWQVLAFEPDNANRAVLEERVGANNQVTIVPMAVSDEPRQGLDFFASNVSSGISGLSAFHASHEKTQSVDATTLAQATADHGIDRIDFLKIDTEGHDLFVLKGADWSKPPEVIICEFEDRKTGPLGYRLPDMVSYLAERGYKVTISEWRPIVEYGQRHRWRRFTDNAAMVPGDAWGNLIAYRDDRRFSELAPGAIGALKNRIF